MPNQKSLELPSYLTRILPQWQTPDWLQAGRWRQIVYNQPVAVICRETIVNDLIASDFEIRTVNPKEATKYASDIEAYTDILNVDIGNGLIGFDFWLEKGIQDLTTLPVGWNNEVVRHPSGPGTYASPSGGDYVFKGVNPKGHVYKIAFIDGATVFPTYDVNKPIGQKLVEDVTKYVFFEPKEIARTVMSCRPEITRGGYGMPPIEKIYLASNALSHGDQYYAALLLDTPEAGILDLGDMAEESAVAWLDGFKNLFGGVDPWKIPVLYEHEKPVNWIPFGRPPTDMMFDTITMKYSQVVHAGYGLMLGDTGLGQGGSTLAGTIREERRTRRSGFAVSREKTKNLIDANILPPYLRFVWMDKDEESKVQKGRSFLTYSQALKSAIETKVITAEQALTLLKEEGYISSEIKYEKQEESAPPAGAPPTGNITTPNQMAKQVADKVPPEEGGLGDVTGKSMVVENNAPVSKARNGLDALLTDEFYKINSVGLNDDRLKKLIRLATKMVYDEYMQVAKSLTADEIPLWSEERRKVYLEQKSEFDAYPDVLKASKKLVDELKAILDKEGWWKMPTSLFKAISLLLKMGFEDGAVDAIKTVRDLIYAEDIISDPNLISLAFDLSNPETLAQLDEMGAALVTNIDDGTRMYLARTILNGAEQGLSSKNIVGLIKEGAGIADVLKQTGFLENVMAIVRKEIAAMSDFRVKTIVDTEITRAESYGRVKEWKEMGLTRKRWQHSGKWDACNLCITNIELGFVPIDYLYDDVFGGKVLGPPAHPHCHGHIEFDENEMLLKAGSLNVWNGS